MCGVHIYYESVEDCSDSYNNKGNVCIPVTVNLTNTLTGFKYKIICRLGPKFGSRQAKGFGTIKYMSYFSRHSIDTHCL